MVRYTDRTLSYFTRFSRGQGRDAAKGGGGVGNKIPDTTYIFMFKRPPPPPTHPPLPTIYGNDISIIGMICNAIVFILTM